MAWPSSTFVPSFRQPVDFRGGDEPRVFVPWVGNYADGYDDGLAAGGGGELQAVPTEGQLWPRSSYVNPENILDVALEMAVDLYWPLDTDANDDSGNARHGTLADGAAITAGVGPFGAGAVDLPGSGAKVTSTFAPWAGGSFSLFGWFRPDVSGTNQTLMAASVTVGPWLYLGPAQPLNFRSVGTTATQFTGATWGAVGTWAPVSVSFNDLTDEVSIYLNGVPLFGSIATALDASPGTFQVGSRASSQSIDGAAAHVIADARVWTPPEHYRLAKAEA